MMFRLQFQGFFRAAITMDLAEWDFIYNFAAVNQKQQMKQLFGILNLGSIQNRHGFESCSCTIMPMAETKWHPTPCRLSCI